MAQGIIYMVDGDGLKRMTPSAPDNEDRMQALVARYPELIMDGDGDLLLIRREAPVGDGESDGRWSLDHLFVTREGVPVLVELKRAVDTRLRREVVGQMLDYAANATAHWGAGAIARSFAAAADPDEADTRLSDFIGEREPDEFWRAVDGNLAAGRIKLVFVADTIPRELALIVEFLNGQMRADVRAVELRWFAGEGGVTTLSPRVIGETERAAAGKRGGGVPPSVVSVEEWINQRLAPFGDEAERGGQRFVELVEAMGARAVMTGAQGAIAAQVELSGAKPFKPFQVSTYARLKLMLGSVKDFPPFQDERARRDLYDEFASIVGPLHTAALAGGPGCDVAVLLDDEVAKQVAAFGRRVVEAVRAARAG